MGPPREVGPDQRDEDSLPAYALLDRALELHLDGGLDVPQMAELGEEERLRHPLEADVLHPELVGVGGPFDPDRKRLAEPFEQLRDASDRVLQKTGARPKVFLANLGNVAEFTARATFAKNFFEAGGIEAVANEGFKTQDDMIAAGLARPAEDGRPMRDFFFNRVMFPISDGRGRTIAFGARALEADAKPKYINTGETPMPLRRKVWGRLATDLKPRHLAEIAHDIAALGCGHIAPGLKRLRRRIDRAARLGRTHPRHVGDRLAGGRVDDGERDAGIGVDPLAVTVVRAAAREHQDRDDADGGVGHAAAGVGEAVHRGS